MALKDHYGNVLTTHSEAARDHYDRGVALFQSVNFGALGAFQRAVQEDPGFAQALAAVARISAMGGDMTSARKALSEAVTRAEQATSREKAHVAIMADLIDGRVDKVRTAVKAHVQDYPRDAMIAQICCNVFGLIGFSGDAAREAELFAFTSDLLPHYGEDWWMMSMHALSLCETGQIDASIALMEKSLTINPRNANGSHFKAHALYEAGETAAGRAYLTEWLGDYDKRAGLHGHLSWHGALWALHAGDVDAMWTAVDSGVGPGASLGMPINIVTDTAAILFRAELAGFDVDPKRWAQISAYASKTFPNPGQSFVDIHAALAHAMAGDGENLARIAETEAGFAGDLVRPVARSWQKIVSQDWAAALSELTPIMHSSVRLGGSRAQRDLLELTYAHVLLKLGKTDEARRTLSMRRPILSSQPPLSALHAA